MVRIAICDDKALYVGMLSGMIRCWAKRKCLNLQLEIFQSGEEILCATEETGSFFVVFMDIKFFDFHTNSARLFHEASKHKPC